MRKISLIFPVYFICCSGARADNGGPAFNDLVKAVVENTAVAPPAVTDTPDLAGSLSQAVGSYSSGSLLNAAALPLEGTGFVKIERARDRHYGTEETIHALAVIGLKYSEAFPGSARLQIGDISVKGGGEVSLHASHQNGLDADAAMIATDEREQDPLKEGFDENFVSNGAVAVRFDADRNWMIVKAAAENTGIARIFVDPAIKTLFCAKFGADEDNRKILHFLRPAAHHDDHFHLRFECPADDMKCVKQEPPPPGDGCDAIALRYLEQP